MATQLCSMLERENLFIYNIFRWKHTCFCHLEFPLALRIYEARRLFARCTVRAYILCDRRNALSLFPSSLPGIRARNVFLFYLYSSYAVVSRIFELSSEQFGGGSRLQSAHFSAVSVDWVFSVDRVQSNVILYTIVPVVQFSFFCS